MTNFRIGFAGAHKHTFSRRVADASCATGGFYKSPAADQVVNASQPLTMSWDTTCLDVTAADIYLYAPSNKQSLIQIFKDVDFQKGSYTTTLKPQWWNRTSTVELQLAIIQSGSEPFLATLPAGPIWEVQYTPSASDSNSIFSNTTTQSGVTEVNNLASSGKGGLSKGAIAAAVLVPIIVLGIALGVYIRYMRIKEKKSRKRWSEAVDKRMSAMSTDWRSLTTQGAEAAIRASFVGPSAGNRVSFGGSAFPRPPSMYAPGHASSGAEGQMEQVRRPGVGLRSGTASGAERASRISFAADTRFSRTSTIGENTARPRQNGGRTGVPSRAFHSGYIPPVPSHHAEFNNTEVHELQRSGLDGDFANERAMSPRQMDGPAALGDADIQKMAHHTASDSSSLDRDSVLPALSMMRAMNASGNEAVIQPSSSPAPSYSPMYNSSVAANIRQELRSPPPVAPKSPVMDAMPMQPMHSGVMMNPDDMLKIYAERRRTGASTGTSDSFGSRGPSPAISFPMPAATPTTPRMLYSPGPTTPTFETGGENEDAYFGGN